MQEGTCTHARSLNGTDTEAGGSLCWESMLSSQAAAE